MRAPALYTSSTVTWSMAAPCGLAPAAATINGFSREWIPVPPSPSATSPGFTMESGFASRADRAVGECMAALVSVHNVIKRYLRGKQVVEVLHQLDLEVPTGQFLALMGPSGSGKTTLLNLIGGLDRPTSGEVIVAGERIDQLSSSELARWRSRHVGFVFQFYNLMPMLSAERNIELPLLLTSLSSAQRARNVATALELVGLTDHAKHKPAELS